MKKFYVQMNVGMAKYCVNYHNGTSKHADGSEFFELQIFKNKKQFDKFIATLRQNGYAEI